MQVDRVFIHEAGHAVAYHAFGVRPVLAWGRPGIGGRCVAVGDVGGFGGLIVLAAGQAAEAVLRPFHVGDDAGDVAAEIGAGVATGASPMSVGLAWEAAETPNECTSDFDRVAAIVAARRGKDGGDAAVRLWWRAYDSAKRLLRLRWEELRVLSAELARRGAMSAAEIDLVLSGSTGARACCPPPPPPTLRYRGQAATYAPPPVPALNGGAA